MANLSSKAAVRSASPKLGRLALRQCVPLAIVAMTMWLLKDRLASVDVLAVGQSVARVSIWQWGVALIATAASFWAVGRYDAVIHGLLNTNVSRHSATKSGFAAIAIAQFAGFGVLTGALVRWRMLPDVSLWQATRISLTVSGSFLAGWAVVSAIFVLLAAPQFPALQFGASLVLIGAMILALASLWQPKRLPVIPPLRAMSAIISLAMLDTLLACAAFWVLLPPEVAVPLLALIPAFLLALGAGLLGGTPGGVGPFEVTLLAALPVVENDAILGAALAFRLVYYALPALIAALVVLFGPTPSAHNTSQVRTQKFASPFLPHEIEQEIWGLDIAEANLIRQGEFQLVSHDGRSFGAVARTGQSLVMLSDFWKSGARNLQHISEMAKASGLSPIIYKCGKQTAALARRQNWCVVPVAKECWVDTGTFSTDRSKSRQLRRMLRKAEDADVTVREISTALPFAQMSVIANEWAAARGGERGFSMGRYDPDYVSCQRIFMAYRDGNPIAFITLHEVANEWTLDLMRHGNGTPEGTMHLLVRSAINAAAKSGCPRLSLAAVSPDIQITDPFLAHAKRYLDAASGAQGLARFKQSFAPHFETRYAAAPNKIALAVGLWDILRRIDRTTHRPTPPSS